ncbi:universal stress protein [Williamsia sterculiae]|uniref:Nucleotide-binding universal stress protein, UspA family n=1 Tax=Williamsia sterculiae TaxID=1344003 RepID=A0A1N7GQ40_9NOCA|nr:universal stress protein [Williamsia sterculiae]SIS14715.1 Nucleotide-binding universal stress protein, UspA family [Williamsia sterculiae]
MSVAVGYLPGPGANSALELAVALARELHTGIGVMTVVPRPWATPSMAKVDAEFSAYAGRLAAEAHDAAAAHLHTIDVDVPVSYRSVPDRSAGEALMRVSRETEAQVLVLGSSAGETGKIRIGSTISRLLHSADLPIALAPNDFTYPDGGITGLTCAWSGLTAARGMIAEAGEIAAQVGVRLRVTTFGVTPAQMYPTSVGFDAEQQMLDAWREQMVVEQDGLVGQGVIGSDVERVVATGRTWVDAVGSIDWPRGEMLVIGTTSRWATRRIFLGSTATRIVTASPVPVLVLPG